MSHLSKIYSMCCVVFGLLLSINCYATDSTDIFKMALKNSKKIPMSQETVPDVSQCIDAPTQGKDAWLGGLFFTGKSVSTCPSDYPLPHTVASSSEATVFSCCKAKVEYKQTT